MSLQAKYTEQIPLHTKAMSLANSVTANPPGHMAIHYNPAGLTLLSEGTFFSQGLNMVGIIRDDSFSPDPDYKIQFDNGTISAMDDPVSGNANSGNFRRIYFPLIGTVDSPFTIAPVPVSFSYHDPSQKWTFAWGVYMPVSWSTSHHSDDPSVFQSESKYFQHVVYASPSFGYQVTDYFSIGISFGLGQSAYGINSDMRLLTKDMANVLSKRKIDYYGSSFEWKPMLTPFDKFADFELSLRDDYAPSVNLGVLWQPISQLTVGAVYRSPILYRLKGDYTIEYSNRFKGLVQIVNGSTFNSSSTVENSINDIIKDMTGPGETGKAIINNYYYPQQVQIGLKFQPIEKLRLMLDVNWQNWSSIDNQTIEFGSPLKSIALYHAQYSKSSVSLPDANKIVIKKKFDDVFNFSLGIEYQMFESLCMRMGYENRPTATDDTYFDLTTLPDTHFIGAGLGLRLKKEIVVDLGIGYIFNSHYDIRANESYNLNSDNNPISSPYPGQNYDLKLNAYMLSANITMPFREFKNLLSRYY